MKGKNDTIEIPIEKIGEKFSNLRIIRPKVEDGLARSLEKYGQVSPVIVAHISGDQYEMIDGFKRLRAARRLSFQTLSARVFDGGSRALKAAMFNLNSKFNSMTELEQGLVIRSLHREDNLNQVEIATLLGRHKSWVCRRLSLVERLCDEVLENLKIGLINISTARELARLPCGNQSNALKTILKHQLTCHETARLVSLLMREPRCNHETILDFPGEILNDRQPDRPRQRSTPADLAYEKLITIERMLSSNVFSPSEVFKFSLEELKRIESLISSIEKSLDKIKTGINTIF